MQRRKVQMSAYVARFNGSSENLIQINRHHRSNEMDGQLTIGYFPQEKHGCGFHWLITNYYQSIKCTILSILQFKGGKSFGIAPFWWRKKGGYMYSAHLIIMHQDKY